MQGDAIISRKSLLLQMGYTINVPVTGHILSGSARSLNTLSSITTPVLQQAKDRKHIP